VIIERGQYADIGFEIQFNLNSKYPNYNTSAFNSVEIFQVWMQKIRVASGRNDWAPAVNVNSNSKRPCRMQSNSLVGNTWSMSFINFNKELLNYYRTSSFHSHFSRLPSTYPLDGPGTLGIKKLAIGFDIRDGVKKAIWAAYITANTTATRTSESAIWAAVDIIRIDTGGITAHVSITTPASRFSTAATSTIKPTIRLV
jgi:hypothetical protein